MSLPPVFILSRDRLGCLQLLLDKLQDFEVTIIDVGSTYEPLLQFYTDNNMKVVQGRHRQVSFWVEDQFKKYRKEHYILTDSDVVPWGDVKEHIGRFKELLEKYKRHRKVGYGLWLEDIPDHYPLKEHVLNWERRFWTKPLEQGVYDSEIDTTFALYRPRTSAGTDLALRTCPPVARHTSWYLDPQNLPEDERYYMEHMESGITHWTAPMKAIYG